MIGWMFRTTFFLAGLIGAVYLTFYVPLGDKPLSGHVVDVWNSDVVQKKVAQVRNEWFGKDRFRIPLFEKLGPAAGTAAFRDPESGEKYGIDDLTNQDREELDELVQELQRKRR